MFLFIFSKLWFFRFLGGSKGKNGSKWQKTVCCALYISQESYIIWSMFIVHMCNRMISPGFFYIYSKFLFLEWASKREKNSPKWRIIMFAVFHISWSIYASYDCDFWYTCVKWWHLQMVFSFILNFDFPGSLGVGRGGELSIKWQ